MAKTLRRPSKQMMLAVNASIDGNEEEVKSLKAEFKLDQGELTKRLEMRAGEKYSFERKSRAKKDPEYTIEVENLENLLTEETKIAVLIRVGEKAKQLLEAKPKDEVTRITKAISDVEKLRKQYEAALELIR